MPWLEQALKALPTVASSPLALAAYALTLAALVFLAMRVQRAGQVLKNLKNIPPKDRRYVIQSEMNVVLPESITAEDWLRSRREVLVFAGFIAVLLCVTLVVFVSYFSGASQPSLLVSGPGPAFNKPLLNGRTIDSCLVSSQISEPASRCSHPAKQMIADAFCKAAGYARAVAFKNALQDKKQASFIFNRDLGPNGRIVETWTEFNEGGSIFVSITCAH